MPPTLHWNFPLPRTHTGVLLGNGIQGLMVWGTDRLCITIGRAGFWDHRGGNLFASRTTYAEVRRLLEANDEPALRRVFANPERAPGTPPYPTQIGGGRVEVVFREGFRPQHAELDTGAAKLTITLADPAGRTAVVTLRQAIDREFAWLELDEAAHGPFAITLIPTWEYVGEQLSAWGVEPPETWSSSNAGGFIQRLPADEPLALAWHLRAPELPGSTTTILALASALGSDCAVRSQAMVEQEPVAGCARRAESWWIAYWESAPRVALPDATVQHAWDYGVYKLAGLTTPGGVPASLQGPWIEEYQLPPWSCDYHFNINVQMIYWPCLAVGCFDHLWPMWDMLLGWFPRLRENAAHFFGAPDAFMMPHAVDDRCAAVGAFWTGMIDQACTAWMAQLAWLHYRYSGDERVLREVAWPLLQGAFNGYWAMLETIEDAHGPRLSLPVSVSPEYNGDRMDAWGRDASFQLAAIHFLAQALPQAAALLGRPADERWGRVQAELPPYTLAGPPPRTRVRLKQEQAVSGQEPQHPPRIALWEGQDLDVSHRHHAHLGGIYPFCTIDPDDADHNAVVRNTLNHWIWRGAGEWSGWCVPWASIICARCGMPEAAVLWLHWWDELFTNEGHGTLHNSDFPGATTMWGWPRNPDGSLREIMQSDAGMGAVTAVVELLVQCRGDTIAVLPGIPRQWQNYTFDGIRVEGGFRVGATVEHRRIIEVRVESTRDGPLCIAHGIPGSWTLGNESFTGPILERATTAGERIVIRAAVHP